MQESPKVVLLIETARGFGRDLLLGIAKYSRLNGPWSFHITHGDLDQVVPKMKEWGSTGIIARITDDCIARAVVDANLPTVVLGLSGKHLRQGSPLSKFPEIGTDPKQISQLAAEHLLERGFTRFAYVGSSDRFWSDRRERAFREFLAKRGFEPSVYPTPKRLDDRIWEREQVQLAKWIRNLPVPIGLFACDDHRGRQVLDACRSAGLLVPEDVAVVGVDNDKVSCELANPPLSSVAVNSEMAGYRAAALLDAMMRGRAQKRRKIAVEAIGVVARRSTEILAIDDPEVAGAIQFIRRHRGHGISVDRVADEVAISRRSLEKRFRGAIGRTILEEIQIARLEHAKRLLLETSYPISKVAEIAGFNSTGYFIQCFQTHLGKTPRQYRVALTT